MASVIAYIALFVLLAFNGVASNWFVYGLWPHSWWLFLLFNITAMIIILLMQMITNEGRR